MKRMFIESNEFRKHWGKLGMGEENLRELEYFLLEHPESGNMIQGTGGVRKLRWAKSGRGKSGGVRIIYIDFAKRGITWLITVFGKNEATDLSAEERRQIRSFVKEIKE